MPNRNAEAIRPSSILHAWDTTWKVLENNTLDRTLILGDIEDPLHRKKVRYAPGQEIFLRWEPINRI
jgi:hypothetical protein